jgi:hypothetical protein
LITAWRVLLGRQSDLARRGDRIVAAARLAVVPLLLLMAGAATVAALGVLHTGHVRERVQLRTMQQVQGTVLRVNDMAVSGSADASTSPAWDVRVQWRDPTGATRRTSMVVLQRQKPGDRMTMWLDARGRPVTALWSASDSVATAIFAGLGVLSVGALLLAGAVGLLRSTLTRHQLERWTTEWELVSSTWSSR